MKIAMPFAGLLKPRLPAIALFAALFVSSGAGAADNALPDLTLQRAGGGTDTLRKVQLIKVEPDGLRVMHAAGMAKVPLEQLPAELVSRYGLDAGKAAEFRATQAQTIKQATPAPVMPPPVAETPAPKEITLWTKEAVLAVWLANADPRKIHPLDRELGRKREAAIARAKAIRAGECNSEAQIAAHEANAKLLAEAGDAAGAEAQRQAAEAGKKTLNEKRKAAADRRSRIALEYTIINGRPPLWSVGGGGRAP